MQVSPRGDSHDSTVVLDSNDMSRPRPCSRLTLCVRSFTFDAFSVKVLVSSI